MQPTVQFLNHSCVLITDGNTRILCDPWFKGSAFHNGWSLLHENSHDINSLGFDYIWLSHEHPDHFSIPTLAALGEAKTFLYQETTDKKIKHYLEGKGHTVIELADQTPTDLGTLQLTSFVCDGYDSSLLVRFSNGQQFLNINDARVDQGDELLKLKAAIGDSVDLLTLQYSYANWAGNEDDVEIPAHQQALIDEKNLKARDALNPEAMMVFASMIYFSHEENFYWNKKNWLPHVVEALDSDACDVIVPKPEQSIIFTGESVETDGQNSAALAYWEDKYSKISVQFNSSALLDDAALVAGYEKFYDKLWQQNDLQNARSETNSDFTLALYLTDREQVVQLKLFEKKSEFAAKDAPYDAAVSCETFAFLMSNAFARGTITINGRIKFNYPTAHRFFFFFFLRYANNIGICASSETPLTRERLESITRTSVMTSILRFNDAAGENMRADLGLFGAAGAHKHVGA